MQLHLPFRRLRLSTRLALTLTATFVLATAAQALLYFQTRNETIHEADESYQTLAKAIEVAATQMGTEGWKDPRVLEDYRVKLQAKGLRDIQVTEAGRPFPQATAPAPAGRKRARPASMKDIVISGTVSEGEPTSVLQVPLVVDGRFLGWVRISYSLENISAQLVDNFRRRLYALVGVFALGLAFILVLTRNATRPLEDLSDAAAKVAGGDLDVNVPVDRDDEVGRLARTFNRMTEALRERQGLETRLAAAEKRAEIGHLASGLAHEIKNPLNALSLGLDVLRRRHRPADETAAAEHAARIEALRGEINRLATLINNFLSYGRPLTLTLSRVDLGEVVRATVADLSETAERSRVEILLSVTDALPPMRADGSLLKSAIWNLVQNAVQAMERTGGTVRVTLAREEPAEQREAHARLVVEDEGPGFEQADASRLFEPYYSRREGGVGLGLAMVKRIVEEHGGRVEASNRAEGTGARFVLSLPLTGPAAAPACASPSAAASEG